MKYKIGDIVKLNRIPESIVDDNNIDAIDYIRNNNYIVTIMNSSMEYYMLVYNGQQSYLFNDYDIDSLVYESEYYSEGQVVTIVNDLDSYWMNSSMRYSLGKEATILEVTKEYTNRITYRLDVDNKNYVWRNVDFKNYYDRLNVLYDKHSNNELLNKIYKSLGS